MPSKYSINVALNGTHYFRVESELWDQAQALGVFNELCSRFTAAEGFGINLTYYKVAGTQVATRVA